MSKPLATIGIISIGQMGLGIAKLLTAHRYKVLTNVSDRSPATQARAREAQLGLVSSDVDLVSQSDYIFSIVPPRDAMATASRIIDAVKAAQRDSSSALYFLDLNAISPSTALKIASAFEDGAKDVRFVDGGIIGGPPSPVADSSEWKKPGVPLSGPFPLHEAPVSGEDLAQVFNTRYLDEKIGSASGLKCCFAALSKGMTALALQSFTTASSLGVVPDLQFYLSQYNPKVGERVASSITGCPSKAYRWVEEMNQIGDCFAEVGGWADQAKVFREIAGVYQGLADVVEKRGGTEGMDKIEGAISALEEGLKDKK
ncbi:6-phosphogluconate dehydrogenase C-terminal domain-like protein [Corynespora cassiicola Philippines]|uniref:6-phosphogluconate dehydrogenase C-terminal domain-like protein n=1 Tax=Corynespora cassiicola Philippines TaxID=1448308 RepID=A0A2T2NX45_CORCC|nr:6-phosphogluconate dehydrogenase C-terminal domain-like protein [Corynespora cassiicola Philippines]